MALQRRLDPNDFSVEFNGAPLIAETDIPQQDYTEFTFDVTATATTR